MSVVFLCHIDEMPECGSRGFDPEGRGRDTLFLVKRRGALYGYLDLCPHYGDTTLPWQKDAYLDGDGDHIVCAAHGAQFLVASGECVSGPCYGQQLTPVELSVGDDGRICVTL